MFTYVQIYLSCLFFLCIQDVLMLILAVGEWGRELDIFQITKLLK